MANAITFSFSVVWMCAALTTLVDSQGLFTTLNVPFSLSLSSNDLSCTTADYQRESLQNATNTFFGLFLADYYSSGDPKFEETALQFADIEHCMGVPASRFNLYVNAKARVTFAEGPNLPTRVELFKILKKSITEEFTIDYVRKLDGPFLSVSEVLFRQGGQTDHLKETVSPIQSPTKQTLPPSTTPTMDQTKGSVVASVDSPTPVPTRATILVPPVSVSPTRATIDIPTGSESPTRATAAILIPPVSSSPVTPIKIPAVTAPPIVAPGAVNLPFYLSFVSVDHPTCEESDGQTDRIRYVTTQYFQQFLTEHFAEAEQQDHTFVEVNLDFNEIVHCRGVPQRRFNLYITAMATIKFGEISNLPLLPDLYATLESSINLDFLKNHAALVGGPFLRTNEVRFGRLNHIPGDSIFTASPVSVATMIPSKAPTEAPGTTPVVPVGTPMAVTASTPPTPIWGTYPPTLLPTRDTDVPFPPEPSTYTPTIRATYASGYPFYMNTDEPTMDDNEVDDTPNMTPITTSQQPISYDSSDPFSMYTSLPTSKVDSSMIPTMILDEDSADTSSDRGVASDEEDTKLTSGAVGNAPAVPHLAWMLAVVAHLLATITTGMELGLEA